MKSLSIWEFDIPLTWIRHYWKWMQVCSTWAQVGPSYTCMGTGRTLSRPKCGPISGHSPMRTFLRNLKQLMSQSFSFSAHCEFSNIYYNSTNVAIVVKGVFCTISPFYIHSCNHKDLGVLIVHLALFYNINSFQASPVWERLQSTRIVHTPTTNLSWVNGHFTLDKSECEHGKVCRHKINMIFTWGPGLLKPWQWWG